VLRGQCRTAVADRPRRLAAVRRFAGVSWFTVFLLCGACHSAKQSVVVSTTSAEVASTSATVTPKLPTDAAFVPAQAMPGQSVTFRPGRPIERRCAGQLSVYQRSPTGSLAELGTLDDRGGWTSPPDGIILACPHRNNSDDAIYVVPEVPDGSYLACALAESTAYGCAWLEISRS
jgi:hypothetical protein